MRANYHCHSSYCDGKATMADMAEAAFAQGYKVLGFSSHAPFPTGKPWVMEAEDLPAYRTEIEALAKAWAPRGLEILKGLEVDYFPPEISPQATRFEALDLDYRIGSVHFVRLGDEAPFSVDCDAADLDKALATAPGGAVAMYQEYYACLGRMIEAGGFDILGHFDLVKKNNAGNRLFDEDSPEYRRAALEVVGLLEARDCVVEINLGAMARKRRKEPYPSLEILKAMKEKGLRITISADAHEPSHLGIFLEEARELAQAAGYRSVAVLTGGQWKEAGLAEI